MSRREFLRPNLLLLGIAICYFFFGVGKSRLLFHVLPMLFAYKLLTVSALMGLVFMFVYAIELVNLRTKFFYFLGIAVPAFFATRILMSPDLISASIRVKEWFSGSIPLLLVIGLVSVYYARTQPVFIRLGLASLAVVAVNDILVGTKTIQNATIMDFGYCIFIISMMIRQLIETKRGWIDLSLKQSELQWSEKFLKLSRQVAHDVRNPIGAMTDSIKRLHSNLKNAAKDDLDDLSKGLERLESISDKIMREYRSYFEKGDKNLLPMPKLTMLDVLIGQIIDEVRSIAPKEIIFKIKGLPLANGIWGVVDIGEISAAIANILRNALEAIGEKKHGIIQIIFSYDEQKMELKIEDNGAGISESSLYNPQLLKGHAVSQIACEFM